jgi:hypothetical protein
MSTTTPEQILDRIAKHAKSVADEEAIIAGLNADLRKFASPKNPRARHLRAQRKQADGRLYTARQRLAKAHAAAKEAGVGA